MNNLSNGYLCINGWRRTTNPRYKAPDPEAKPRDNRAMAHLLAPDNGEHTCHACRQSAMLTSGYWKGRRFYCSKKCMHVMAFVMYA